VLILACYGGSGASFRPHGGEARRAVDPTRHRSLDGRDRRVAGVPPSLRDRDRARRVRQDDAAGCVGRDGSASLCLGFPGRAGRRRRPVPPVHRRRDAPRAAGRARGVRRTGRPGRIDLADRYPARRKRAGCPRASDGAGARRPTLSRARPASTRSPPCASTSHREHRSRSRAGRSRPCRWPADGRGGGWRRSAWPPAPRRPGGRWAVAWRGHGARRGCPIPSSWTGPGCGSWP
jgi:hypothetical protein